MKLYELTGKYQQLQELAEDEYADPKMIADTVEALDGEIEEEADALARIIRGLEGNISGLDDEIERLKRKKNAMERNINFFKKSIENAMIVTGKRKIKTNLFAFGIQKNAPSLEVLDEGRIPQTYWIAQEPKLDRRALLSAVKSNPDDFDGIAIAKQTESLRIR